MSFTAGKLLVNAREIPLVLFRNPRARRYVLRLRPDGTARVTIPRGGTLAEGQKFAERNLDWLKRQLERLAVQPVRATEWRLGAEILFRGELVKVQLYTASKAVRALTGGGDGLVPVNAPETGLVPEARPCPPPESDSSKPRIAPDAPGNTICFGSEVIRVLDVQSDLRSIIEKRLWKLAARELPARVFELAAPGQFPVRRVTVRNQRSRWGSCSRRGTISLNWRLIQSPPFVRDYIIYHELCHLREMNHSHRFWRLVEQVCPYFKIAERWLKQSSLGSCIPSKFPLGSRP